MTNEFVTVATFSTPPPAHLALGMLREAGITAMLRNENIVAGAWDLGQATRGVEVQVPPEDARRAHAMLEEAETHGGPRGAESPSRVGSGTDAHNHDHDDDDDDDRRTPEERALAEMANRAVKSAGLGIVLPPLQLYSLWLLIQLQILTSGGRGTAEIRKQMRTALLMDMFVIVLIAIVVGNVI